MKSLFTCFHSEAAIDTKTSINERKFKIGPIKLLLNEPFNFTIVEEALSLFNRTLQLHSRPSIICFNKNLGELAKTKHYSAVITLHKQICLSEIIPDDYTLAILINSFCSLHKVGFSLSVVGRFFKLGYKLNICTFPPLIKGFCLEGKQRDAAESFNKMVKEGCRPNVVTYGTLINKLTIIDSFCIASLV